MCFHKLNLKSKNKKMLYDFCRGNISCLACLFSKLHLTSYQEVYSVHHLKLCKMCFLWYKQQSCSMWTFGYRHSTARFISHLKICAACTRSLDHMSCLCQHYQKVPCMSLCFLSQKVEARLFGAEILHAQPLHSHTPDL